MPKPPIDPRKRRSEQATAMLTPPEKEALLRIRDELGMSTSNASRYLILKGMAAHRHHTRTPDERE